MPKAKTDRRRRVAPIVAAVVQPVAKRLSHMEALLIEMRYEQDVQPANHAPTGVDAANSSRCGRTHRGRAVGTRLFDLQVKMGTSPSVRPDASGTVLIARVFSRSAVVRVGGDVCQLRLLLSEPMTYHSILNILESRHLA